jgi:aldose sugar dehydrogenase
LFLVSKLFLLLCVIVLVTSSTGCYYYSDHYAYAKSPFDSKGPIINDRNLKAEVVVGRLEFPTSMAFIGPDDILVLEKNNGNVRRIVNSIMLPKPLLDVNVANENERGMLGIAVAKNTTLSSNTTTYVFLYYTESGKGDGNDNCPKISFCKKGNDPLGNRLYRYELDHNKLVHPKLLLDLPATPGSDHNGGKVLIGPDNNVYLLIGDISSKKSQTGNVLKGPTPDGRGGILRITQDGKLIKGKRILGDGDHLNLYYAYGIRNGFGLDFDPITGKLWDTENGPSFGDEINLVEPGFNSGWNKVQGLWPAHNSEPTARKKGYFGGDLALDNSENLVNFNGKGNYSSPEFTWNKTIGLTSLKFLNSDKLGKQYENDIFVADIHNGNIYHFDLNEPRTGLLLKGNLEDKVANSRKETSSSVFATGFSGITDIQVGPDGYLYVLSFFERSKSDRQHYYGYGTLFRIVPPNH